MLSGNSIDHLLVTLGGMIAGVPVAPVSLVTLGGMIAGVPVAPVSVAYSLQSRDHARIRAITESRANSL